MSWAQLKTVLDGCGELSPIPGRSMAMMRVPRDAAGVCHAAASRREPGSPWW